jgi:hypothetical protein
MVMVPFLLLSKVWGLPLEARCQNTSEARARLWGHQEEECRSVFCVLVAVICLSSQELSSWHPPVLLAFLVTTYPASTLEREALRSAWAFEWVAVHMEWPGWQLNKFLLLVGDLKTPWSRRSQILGFWNKDLDDYKVVSRFLLKESE